MVPDCGGAATRAFCSIAAPIFLAQDRHKWFAAYGFASAVGPQVQGSLKSDQGSRGAPGTPGGKQPKKEEDK